jgi:hypothetical protein
MSVRVAEQADDRFSGHSLGQITRSRSGFVDVIRIRARLEQELDCLTPPRESNTARHSGVLPKRS